MTDRETNRATARELAAKLSPLLPGWTPEIPEEGDWVDLVREDGARIRMMAGGWRQEGRVSFAGCWPRYRDGNGYSGGQRVAITCAQTRSPEAMAKDILRRFLPEYLPQYAKALAYVKAHDENADEAELVAARIADAVGGESGEKHCRNRDGVFVRGGPEHVYRLVVQPAYRSSSGDLDHPVRVDFEVHGLDPETALRVLELIQESKRAEESPLRVALEEKVRVSEPDPEDEEPARVTQVARV